MMSSVAYGTGYSIQRARSALDTVSHEVAVCAIEAEVGVTAPSEAQRHRLRSALTQLRKLR